MDAEAIRQEKQELAERYGPWSASNIYLGHGIYTMDRDDYYDARVRRICQSVLDLAGDRGLRGLRVLDLACLEGIYSIELAQHGAQVLGIEGREANVAKARFAAKALGLESVEFVQDDVRNLSVDKYREFDVVLCMGIQYHLDVPDVFGFMENVARVCRRFAVVDTHISFTNEFTARHGGKEYAGRYYSEHLPETTPEERLKVLWASLDNEKSFWFTRPALLNLLTHCGFTSVHECMKPTWLTDLADRVTFIAMKGIRAEFATSPILQECGEEDLPDIAPLRADGCGSGCLIERLRSRVARFCSRCFGG